jgi:hypothetical protein
VISIRNPVWPTTAPEHDLQALLEAVGAAAKKAGTALVLFVDELLQYVERHNSRR